MLFVKAMDKVNKALTWLIGISLGIVTLVIFYQILVRFVLTVFSHNISAPWTEELARFLMIWNIFIGGAIAARQGKLIAVEALIQAVPKRVRKLLETVTYIICLVFYIWLFFVGLEWTKFGAMETSPVLGISMSTVYMSLSVAAALMFLNTIVKMLEEYLNSEEPSNRDTEVDEKIKPGLKVEEG